MRAIASRTAAAILAIGSRDSTTKNRQGCGLLAEGAATAASAARIVSRATGSGLEQIDLRSRISSRMHPAA